MAPCRFRSRQAAATSPARQRHVDSSQDADSFSAASASRGRRCLDEPLCAPDAYFIEDAHGNGQGQLRDDVRRGHHSCNDERDDDEVAAKLLEFLPLSPCSSSPAAPPRWALGRPAQRQDRARGWPPHKTQYQACSRHAGRRELLDEAKHLVQHKELHKSDAHVSQRAAQHDQRDGEALLVAVESRGPQMPTPDTSTKAMRAAELPWPAP